MLWINVNQHIYFKAKEKGLDVIKEKNIRLEPNSEGFCILPLWQFMSVFGEYMRCFSNEYFETDVCFKEEHMSTDSERYELEKLRREMKQQAEMDEAMEENRRETIKEWKKEWIDTNGETDELEVLITDLNLPESAPYIYEGSFANIPEELEEKKVVNSGKILESSVPARIGAYSLKI